MSTKAWDVVFVAAAVFGALVGAWYYVVGVLQRDRLLARLAAGAFLVFSIVAALYFWRFL